MSQHSLHATLSLTGVEVKKEFLCGLSLLLPGLLNVSLFSSCCVFLVILSRSLLTRYPSSNQLSTESARLIALSLLRITAPPETEMSKMRIQLTRGWLCSEGSQVFAIVKRYRFYSTHCRKICQITAKFGIVRFHFQYLIRRQLMF